MYFVLCVRRCQNPTKKLALHSTKSRTKLISVRRLLNKLFLSIYRGAMAILNLFILTALVSCDATVALNGTSPKVVNSPNATISQHIVGGGDAGPTPYHVSLQKRGHLCGGAIIDQKWILVAAHCLTNGNPNEMTVLAGTNRLSRGGRRFKVSKLIQHPQYDSKRVINDIGLVKIQGSFGWIPKVIEKIGISKSFVNGGQEAIATGWGGMRQNGGPMSDKLQFVRLRVISEDQCKAKLNNIGAGHICTLTKEGEGMCGGDSGGPLASKGNVIGVISFVVGYPPNKGCAAGLPDGFSRVSHYYDWIKETFRRE
ncbi:chymotrypsin-1-like [Topomyia yanbarensis]|uniref:chymotrypsin-1-like n=1 Tax=Topomyia yanbarensis TaxID=2498891 RepID=UPI00273B9D03|nr:chymotrypsin-1-like [Topomyia yanbarensis]